MQHGNLNVKFVSVYVTAVSNVPDTLRQKLITLFPCDVAFQI
jgi:hypothetical protein